MNKRAKSTQPNKMHREPGVLEAEAQVGEWLDCRARITSKETYTDPFCEKWHPPKCLFYTSGNGCRFGKSALMHTARLTNSLARSLKRMVTKVTVAMLKKKERKCRKVRPVVYDYSSNTRQLGCVSQNMEPPKSSSILRKSSNILKPIRCVRFTKAVLRHANIRDQNPLLGMICPSEPHQRNPNAPKFEDRSQEET